MKSLEHHMAVYETQNGARPFTPAQRRRLFHLYRCRKCGAFGAEPCKTDTGKVASARHKARPA